MYVQRFQSAAHAQVNGAFAAAILLGGALSLLLPVQLDRGQLFHSYMAEPTVLELLDSSSLYALFSLYSWLLGD